MKRYTAFLLACVTVLTAILSVSLGAAVSAASFRMGDCNMDNSVDMKDVLVLRKYMAHDTSVPMNETLADVNKDSNFDMKDVLLIRKYMAHMIDLEFVDINGNTSDIVTTTNTQPSATTTTSTTKSQATTTTTQNGGSDPWGNEAKVNPDNPRINFLRDTGYTLGVWWWETYLPEAKTNEYMDLFQQNQVTEIYYESYPLLYNGNQGHSQLHSFVEKAMAKGMRVAVLYDDKSNSLAEGIGDIWEKVENGFLAYKSEYPNDALYAIHCDVEPKGLTEIQRYITNFLEAEVADARSKGIMVELDLPCGWENQGTDNMKMAGGKTAPVYEIIAQECDTMCLMSYRDTPDQCYSFGYAPLQAGSKYGTKVIFGFEYGNSGEVEKVDFSQEDRYYAYTVMKSLKKTIDRKTWNCPLGFAIHSATGWYNLRMTGGSKPGLNI